MSVERLLLFLALATVAYVLLGRWSRRRRAELGIDAGDLVSSDDSRMQAPILCSPRLGLAGRCDHLLLVDGAYVPVEHKPSARRLRPSHVLQVAALCLLIEAAYGARPPYAVVVLAGGVRERVSFTTELERRVLRAMADMREILVAGRAPDPEWVASACGACGFAPVCWDGEPAFPCA